MIKLKKNERLYQKIYNLHGTLMKIIEYNNANDIIVEFQDKNKAKVHTSYNCFKKGNVKNPYDKKVYDVGYIGKGKYKTKINNKKTKVYEVWIKMLQRCYDPYYINKHLTYIDCYVCEEWHNFQNFAKWFYKKYYEVEGERMELDKDILYKNNKIYSPKTCIFVPQRINQLFIKQQRKRGEYPIGVSPYYDKKSGYKRLIVQYRINEGYGSKLKYLDCFPLSEPFHAFYTYKIFKENYIKQIADEYKDLIPQKLYEALYRYEVEIND